MNVNMVTVKVQLNKCEIYVNMTFTFYSLYSALFFWVTRQFTDKTRSRVNSRTGHLADLSSHRNV